MAQVSFFCQALYIVIHSLPMHPNKLFCYYIVPGSYLRHMSERKHIWTKLKSFSVSWLPKHAWRWNEAKLERPTTNFRLDFLKKWALTLKACIIICAFWINIEFSKAFVSWDPRWKSQSTYFLVSIFFQIVIATNSRAIQ